MSIFEILTIVMPVVLIVGAGYVSTWAGWTPEKALPGLGSFATTIAVPAALFGAISQLELHQIWDWRIALVWMVVGFLTIAASMIVAMRFLAMDFSKAAIIGMGGATCNGVMFGLPIMTLAYGDIGFAALSILFTAQSLIIAPATFILADFGQNREKNLAAVIGKSLIDTLKNPLITAIFVGAIFASLQIKLPKVILTSVDLLGVAGPGIALFYVGGVLRSASLAGNVKVISAVLVLKLLLFPALMLGGILTAVTISSAFGWPPLDPVMLGGVFVLSTMPMIGVFVPLAGKFNVEKEAAAAMLPTTVLSAVTISAGLWIANNTRLFG